MSLVGATAERPHWGAAGVFVASILTTLLFWELLPEELRVNTSTDYTSFYEPVGRSLLAGRGYTLENGEPASLRYPPGYPLLLAGIYGLSASLGVSETAVLLAFNLLCTALSAVLVFFISRGVWGPLWGLVPSMLWVTCPFVLWLTKGPNTEMPFVVALYGGFLLFWRASLEESRARSISFLSGLLVGVAMLIRPIAIGMGFVMGTILWMTGRHRTAGARMTLIALLLLGNFVAVIPWQMWIYSSRGRMVLLSTNGYISIREGLMFTIEPKDYQQGIEVPPDVRGMMEGIYARRNEMQSLSDVVSVGLEVSRAQPATMAKLVAIKSARSWYGSDSQRFETPILLIQVLYFILIGYGTTLAWRAGGVSRNLALSVWLTVVYFWGMTALTTPIVRYMVPTMGLLFTLVPAAFVRDRSDRRVGAGT